MARKKVRKHLSTVAPRDLGPTATRHQSTKAQLEALAKKWLVTSINLRLPQEVHVPLARLALERKLAGKEPWSINGIVLEAIGDWLIEKGGQA